MFTSFWIIPRILLETFFVKRISYKIGRGYRSLLIFIIHIDLFYYMYLNFRNMNIFKKNLAIIPSSM